MDFGVDQPAGPQVFGKFGQSDIAWGLTLSFRGIIRGI